MVLSDKQKNIVIETSEAYITELSRLQTKITTRNNEFIEQQGNKSNSMETDLTKLTNEELRTMIVTLGKLQCEFINITSQLTSKIQKVDKEIIKRQEDD